ncbi:hypothetical protein J1605_012943 [Eschrichtius robustus]|uniref:Phosphatase and actin regulator 3 n=1 Tax=Eschrichtius robustus TaxID=9764 RepID=A0AB34GJ82_ESCRO|nr:hypothetical protein J1605_012943 [Eschrichtius robustus]
MMEQAPESLHRLAHPLEPQALEDHWWPQGGGESPRAPQGVVWVWSSLTPSLGFRLPDEMDQTPPVRSEYLVSGIRTPPVRRNSKLATLGRIFKPWKWRKKKNEKLKQTTSALEKKMASRQGREDLIKKGLLEMMEQGKWAAPGRAGLGPGTLSWGSHGGPASPSGWSGSRSSPVSSCGSWT